MEYWLSQIEDYYLVVLLVFYFTLLGRFSILVPVISTIGSPVVFTSVILGIEFIQIIMFYNFYSELIRFFSKIKNRIRLRRTAQEKEPDGPPQGEQPEEKREGFFARRFGKYGITGVFILAAFPFRGCGVWSSVLVGRGLEYGKKKVYAAVALGTVAGILVILLFGALFNQVARGFIIDMNPPEAIRARLK